MIRKEYLENITRWFSYLVSQIHCNTACGLLDINSVAEDFYIPILKYLYACSNLENKNIIKSNFPAIDLGCEQSRKSFQITSENGSGKIVHTLEQFRENNLDNKYEEVYILIITTKQKTYSSKKLEEEIRRQNIAFDKDVHIIDYTDIISKISLLETQELEGIYSILKTEFSKQENFNICREELDNFLSISNNKIEVEKNTKKYIPSIFTESTKTKDKARLFSNPLFFYRKVEDKLAPVAYEKLNEFLSLMELENISSEIPPYIQANTPKIISEIPNYLSLLEGLIAKEKEKIFPYNSWYQGDKKTDFEVKPEKQAMKSLLKLKLESHCAGIYWKYDEALKMLSLCVSKVFLVTSMAGQGKTNFVCDLVENLFISFDIPSVFIPARELNFCEPPLIFNHLSKNKYLSKISDQYKMLGFFDKVAKEISKPFIIVIDGINEAKDLEKFKAEICEFIDAVCQFDFVKVIITCRSEFFEQRFSDILAQPFAKHIYHVTDLKADMSEGNLERILNSYLKHFKITASFSESAASFLKNDLLLLRIFCELNQNKNLGNVNDIYKDKLYEEYLIARIKKFDKKLQKKALPTFYGIAKEMIANNQYSSLVLENFDEQQLQIIEQLVSEDIILRRELPETGLGSVGIEAIGFTYDELRDFILSYYIVNELSKSNFDEAKEFVKQLPKLQVYEGVFKYVYILSKKENNEQIINLCESTDNFELLYSIIIWSMPPEYQSEEDIKKAKKY